MGVTAKPAPRTYAVGAGGRSILCLRCGLRSHHPDDVRHLFCGKCGFHDIQAQALETSPTMVTSALVARAIAIATAPPRDVNPEAVTLLTRALELLDAALAMRALSAGPFDA